jgi:hypothetical protein
MSLSGVRSNRGDGYQTTIALDWALAMLADERIAWLEVDSTSLGADGVPIGVDDVVVKFQGQGTVYCQCKKNQTNFDSWTAVDLRADLEKAARQLAVDPLGRIVFYSRSPFGGLAKLREHAKTQPSGAAYQSSLSAELAMISGRLQEYWSVAPPPSDKVYLRLQQIEFNTTPEIEAMHARQLERLRLQVTQPETAFEALWTRLDQLGARIGGASIAESTHRLTRAELLGLLEQRGISVVPAKSRAELDSAFADVSAIGRSWKRDIGGHHIRRAAVGQLLDAIDARQRSVLLTDGPGSGKTCVILDLLDELKAKKDLAVLFVQAREFAHCRSDEDREAHGLMRDLVGQVSRMAEVRQTVVVIDSLDVLSLARDHSALRFFLRTLDQLALRNNVTVVVACRSFDLKYDSRLAARNWSSIVPIGQLRWDDEIEPLVKRWGIDPAALDEPTRALLLNPRNLALFADVVKRTGAFNVATAQALTRRYLDVVVREDPALGSGAMVNLEAMARQMLIERRLEIAPGRVKFDEEARLRLMSAGVLHFSDSGNLAFGHQTLLDALAVAEAERAGVSLLHFIRSLPAVPFVRPAVRSFLAYLRSTDQKTFRTQVRAVFDSDVAYHIKRLIAESFADIAPHADDWPLIQHVYRQSSSLFDSIYYAATSDVWHTFWHKHLIPIALAERNASLLERHVRRVGEWKKSHPSEVIAFWALALKSDWIDQESVRRSVAHELADFVAWETPDVRSLLDLLVAGPHYEHDGIGNPVGRFVEATNSGDDLLWNRIVGHVRPEDIPEYELRQRLRCEPHEFHDPEFLQRRMSRSEALLEHAIEALEQWSIVRGQRFASSRLWLNEFLQETSFGALHNRLDTHHVGALRILVGAIESAVMHHGTTGTSWWLKNGARLAHNAEGALRYMAIRACTAQPERNRELIREIVRDRTLLESPLRYEFGQLVNASLWLLEDAEQDLLTSSILELHKDKRDAEHGALMEWARRERASLLAAIPGFLRSPAVQKQYLNAEREFWPIERVPHIEMSGGTVVAPFSYERFLEMSDTGVVRILQHYRKGQREDWGSLIGGADHVAWQLREAASRDPERFIRVLSTRWEDIPERFRSSPLAGAATFLEYRFGNLSNGNGEWKPVVEPDARILASLMLDEIQRHPDAWRDTREAADAIEACAHVVEDQLDACRIVAIAGELVAADDSALKRIDERDLITTGINSTRGNAAEAMVILGTRWAEDRRGLPEDFRAYLLAYASDPHPAVRAVLLRRLPWLLHHNPSLGWEAFSRAVASANEAIWSVAERCLYYAYHNSFGDVADYLRTIDATGTGKAREVWGRISALACLSGHIRWDELMARLGALADIDAWRGVVGVLAHNAGAAQHRVACFDGLVTAFRHSPDWLMVAKEMEALFRRRESVIPVPGDLVELRFAALERADRTNGFHLHEFENWLVAVAESFPDLALECATMFADFVSRKLVPIYDDKPIARLLTLLFREAEEREEADSGSMLTQVIRLHDALLSRGLAGLQQWLREAERP